MRERRQRRAAAEVGIALLAASLAACATVPAVQLGKFQLLAAEVRISGTVVRVGPGPEGGDGFDLDLKLDPDQPWLRDNFPVFDGILHLEQYAWSPQQREEKGGHLPSVGEHVAVSGVLVLDDHVHPQEQVDHPERVIRRGVLKAFLPKPELHPYWLSTLETNPAPLPLTPVPVTWWAESYDPAWLANVEAEVDSHPTPGSAREGVVQVQPLGAAAASAAKAH